jgi:hypothetical protein
MIPPIESPHTISPGGRIRLLARRVPSVTAAGLLAAALVSCADLDSTPPVATIAASTDQPYAVTGGPLHLTYAFTPGPDAPVADDHAVFVQGFDDRGHLVWSDDHDPPVPTSQWRPGEQVRYTRTTVLPVVSYIGPLTIEAGLYRDGVRLPLAGPGDASRHGARAYPVATVQVLPQVAGVSIEFGDGWYDREFDGHDPTITWRWTQGSAVAMIDNPRQPLDLYLDLDVPARPFPNPQQVVLSVDGRAVATLNAIPETPSAHRIAISAAALGEADQVPVRLDITPAFVPSDLTTSGDTRELGVRVRHLHIQTRQPLAGASRLAPE